MSMMENPVSMGASIARIPRTMVSPPSNVIREPSFPAVPASWLIG